MQKFDDFIAELKIWKDSFGLNPSTTALVSMVVQHSLGDRSDTDAITKAAREWYDSNLTAINVPFVVQEEKIHYEEIEVEITDPHGTVRKEKRGLEVCTRQEKINSPNGFTDLLDYLKTLDAGAAEFQNLTEIMKFNRMSRMSNESIYNWMIRFQNQYKKVEACGLKLPEEYQTLVMLSGAKLGDEAMTKMLRRPRATATDVCPKWDTIFKGVNRLYTTTKPRRTAHVPSCMELSPEEMHEEAVG